MFDHEEPIEYGVVLGEKLVERNVERARAVDLAEQARKDEAAAWLRAAWRFFVLLMALTGAWTAWYICTYGHAFGRALLIRFTPNFFGS